MKIRVITPAPPRSRSGNRVTALRWARILRGLGHHVRIEPHYRGGRCDALLALHALKSFPSIERFHRQQRGLPLIVALTGTDLYGDIRTSARARRSLDLASRLIVLQRKGLDELPAHARHKTRVIYQSAQPPPRPPAPRKDIFEVCVLGHLREVKDPFRTAMAVKRLPARSRIQVVHVGAALSAAMGRRARKEAGDNPRYRWVGEQPRWKALRLLARCRLLTVTSRMEGGANVVTEAIAAQVPIVSSRISGSIGLLGEDYPGYFPAGDTTALASLLERAEADAAFYDSLKMWCKRLIPLVDPARERQSWADLLRRLDPGRATPVSRGRRRRPGVR